MVKKFRSVLRVTILAAGSGVLAGANPNRVGLLLCSPPTNRYSVDFNRDAVLDQGLTIFPGTTPLVLSGRDFG
jgi:hypothetical protein